MSLQLKALSTLRLLAATTLAAPLSAEAINHRTDLFAINIVFTSTTATATAAASWIFKLALNLHTRQLHSHMLGLPLIHF